jgi:hypothetical protein
VQYGVYWVLDGGVKPHTASATLQKSNWNVFVVCE